MKKTVTRNIKRSTDHKEQYQKYHLQEKIPNNNNLKETGNNRRNTNQREQCKTTTNTQQCNVSCILALFLGIVISSIVPCKLYLGIVPCDCYFFYCSL